MIKIINEFDIIIDVTKQFFNETGVSQSVFSTKMLAPKLGEIEPSEVIEYDKWKNRIIRNTNRLMAGEVEFPLKLKWIWIAALPEEYAKICIRRLFAAAGETMPLPSLAGADGVLSGVSDLLNATATVTEHLEPAYDGVYDKNDSLDASNKLIDSLLSNAVTSVKEARRVHAGTTATGIEYNIKDFKF